MPTRSTSRSYREGYPRAALSAKIRKKYQKYYSVPLGRIRFGQTSRLKAPGMTDCYKIYFQSKYNMISEIAKGVFTTKFREELLLHELAHAEQCYRQGGRNNYAKLWFKSLSVGILRNIKKKHKFNDQNLHKKMPMEIQAGSKAIRLQKKVKNNLEDRK